MKKAVFLILCLTAIIACFTAFADEVEYFILCRPGATVNVRISPKNRAEIIAGKSFGDKVVSDGLERNGYVHVVGLAAEVEDGWIYKALLSEDQPAAVDMMTEVFGGRVACRKYPDGKLIRWLKDGSQVRVYAVTDKWCVTEYGYVMTDFLTIGKGVTE